MTSTSASENEQMPTAPFRPNSPAMRGLAWRAAIVDIAAAAVILDLPAWARTPLSVAAAAVVIVFFLRRSRRRGLLDGVLTAVGVGVVMLMLLGVVINLLPIGMTSVGWGIGIGLAELALLAALASWRPPVAPSGSGPGIRIRRPAIAAAIWTALILGVLTTALGWSLSSYTSTHVEPLALSAVTSSGSAVVTVSSGKDGGPYELRAVSTAGVITVLFRDIDVGPGRSQSFTVVTPPGTRATLQLVKTGDSRSARELILDTTGSRAEVSP